MVSDYDAINGVLSITKARVLGIDRDRTKIDEDRRVVLNAHARAVLECQLHLRERLERGGRIQHMYCGENLEAYSALIKALGGGRTAAPPAAGSSAISVIVAVVVAGGDRLQ